jgi:Phosphodiester glycosidase/Glycosyl transferases group 1
MEYLRSIPEILNILKGENIHTWFDLGLFLDRLRENRLAPTVSFNGSFNEFEKHFNHSNLAFITFHYSIDGVTVEAAKYCQLFNKNYPHLNIHFIAGIIKPESVKIIPEYVKTFELPEIKGFNDWKLYKDFFFTKLERGSETYNKLILEFWEECLQIIEKLGEYIISNSIKYLYLINVCSNPGNVSLSLALILLSEYLGIPVINNNHDFYWEGGSRAIDIELKRKKSGPRDFFFTNSHLGEFFSIIEMLFPWESRIWINVNINRAQSKHLSNTTGINPSNVIEIGTAVDTEHYLNIDKRKKINAFFQFEKILSRYKKQLIAYSVDDVINSKLVDPENTKPILIGHKTTTINKFSAENVIFLQPTRIISRKRIEVGFRLLHIILKNKNFKERMLNTKNLKITILITGPIAAGHYKYFLSLLERFNELLKASDEKIRKKVFLACLFSELDKEGFQKRFTDPAGIPELYNIASLVLLPSKTEGRGLPIIEAAACGTPIFCRRYFPKNVYSEVIGEHLDEKDRLKVIEYDGKQIKSKQLKAIIERVFFPHKFSDEIAHNRCAVIKRYSLQALENNIRDIIFRLYFQMKPNDESVEMVKRAFRTYQLDNNYEDENLKAILNTKNRQYLAGYGHLSFMIYLKSLIDPSHFRIEEQEFRGRAYRFAMSILRKDYDFESIPNEKIFRFFNAVENIFFLREGEIKIRHDHSMSYRHRNKNHYLYQDYTLQEITGIINILYYDIIEPTVINRVEESPHFFTDWDLALLQLTGSNFLAIDDRRRLIEKLHLNIPYAYFPGEFLMHELEFFVLQSARSRLHLSIEDTLNRDILDEKAEKLAKIYVFTQEKNLGRQLNKEETIAYIENGKSEELKLLYEYNVLKVVPTEQWTVGIHFAQLGNVALKILRCIKENNGFLISNRRNAALMTDIINIDRFHIGKVRSVIAENMMGIPMDSGYIQFVPAGIRTVLAYPTPIQTAKDFAEAIRGPAFKKLAKKYGEEELFKKIRIDAENQGSPVVSVLNKLSKTQKAKDFVNYEHITGLYTDSYPYNGILAEVNLLKGIALKFQVLSTKDKPKTVVDFINEFELLKNAKSKIAWNGGYILNAELVGKLGIPESYIGSPLGLLISDGKIICPPLFNKAALLFDKEGKAIIRRVNLKSGVGVVINGKEFLIPEAAINPDVPKGDLCCYDLMWNKEFLPGNGRVLLRFSGNIIKEIKFTEKDEQVPVIPVGLVLSFNKNIFPVNIKEEESVDWIIKEFENIIHAVEAGPLLLEKGEVSIDMVEEGWKTMNSIHTQAARLDYTDMRGPKIAAGIDDIGNLFILAVNGRIRESVGATHNDMALILKERGIKKAMGFDPGGSSTLVVNGITKNISPYNKDYERNVYSLPPEPRAVSNAIIGYIEKVK